MLETDLQALIMQWLSDHSILHWRMPIAGTRVGGGVRVTSALKGFPDIAGVIPVSGRLFAIEIKSPTARARKDQPEQGVWATRLKEAGAVYILARSVDDVRGRLFPMLFG